MIKIEEVEFRDSAGAPFEYGGIHSGSLLAGMRMNVTAYTEDEISLVEELIEKSTVTVEDPFAGRSYQATLTRQSSSYTQGLPRRHYQFEVKEVDEAPTFEVLEIEGHSFSVLRNRESADDDAIGIHVLLRLTQEEFEKLQSLIKPGPIALRRIGIDDSPISRRFGGALWWSSHEENSQKFYKQIVRFYPEEYSPGKWGIASAQEQRALAEIVIALSARYEALLEILAESGHISKDDVHTLITDDWRSLTEDARRILLVSKLTEVEDADLELD